MGLSPRGRGNPIDQPERGQDLRSIPAWAGKPWTLPKPPGSPGVYPRVGGETVGNAVTVTISGGLSPRGRGNLVSVRGGCPGVRSIPAWAGKPRPRPPRPAPRRVYPRVGGETGRTSQASARDLGLSPRGRGNLLGRALVAAGGGSIPAWAGKPRVVSLPVAARPVYPRVGGETRRRWRRKYC